MIQAFTGATPPGMARHHSHQVQGRQQAEVNSPEPIRSWGRVKLEVSGHKPHGSPKPERPYDQGQGPRGHCDRGHARFRFGDVVGSAVFADRARMEQRAEFRAEMHDIRTGFRDLMGEVDGGVLTPEQQQTFDGLVKDIVELRESYDFKHWRSADADVISARILDRFGVEPAPSEGGETPDPGAVAPSSASQQPAAEVAALEEAASESVDTVSNQQPPILAEDAAPMDEMPPATQSAAPVETDAVEPTSTSDSDAKDELTVMAERLAGVIADASGLMDDLLEALGG